MVLGSFGMKVLFLVLVFFKFLYVINAFSGNSNLINDLLKTGNHNILVSIIEKNPLFLSLINNSIKSTFYAPTDKAFEEMPLIFLEDIKENNTKLTTKLILSHIFKGDNTIKIKKRDKKENNNMVITLEGSIFFVYDVGDLYVKDIVIRGEAFNSGAFTIIPTDCVMYLQPSTNDKRLDAKIREKYKFTTCCLQTKSELDEFYKGL